MQSISLLIINEPPNEARNAIKSESIHQYFWISGYFGIPIIFRTKFMLLEKQSMILLPSTSFCSLSSLPSEPVCAGVCTGVCTGVCAGV